MKELIKSTLVIMLVTLASITATAADPVKITSPDKKITVELQTAKGEFGWAVSKDGKMIYSINDIRLSVNGKTLGGKATAKGVKQKSVCETIKPVVPLKFSTIENNYTEDYINLTKDFYLHFN